MKNTKKKLLWITETAAMLALLITLQYFTKPLGQIVTGSCVNTVLAVTVLTVGLPGGLVVALVSPVFAWLLNIAPQVILVPAIMAGNGVFVVLLKLLWGKTWPRRGTAVALAAVAKFSLLYLLVVKVICGVLAGSLMEQGLLKQPMLQALPATFSWLQLVTALIGGCVAMAIMPLVEKAIKR